MRLEYSQEYANKFGFGKAKLTNGKEIKFTNQVEDEFDKPEIESKSQWKDKQVVYQGKDSDIVSFDYSNKRDNKNHHEYNLNPYPNMEAINFGLKNHMPIVGSILNIRETALKNSKELPNKKPLK